MHTPVNPGRWLRVSAPPLVSGAGVRLGRFVERPHRFAALVRVENSIVEAHLANPGRLTGVLAPGCSVAVEGPFPPPRVLPYTMLASRAGRVWAGTVTTYANRVFPTLLATGVFPELWVPHEGRPPSDVEGHLRREVVHGRSRFDFEVADGVVEVKSVSLAVNGNGLFPDAVTARGARHCEELAALARAAGRRAAIVFVAQRADITSVAAAETIDPTFARALAMAAASGVLVLACALRMTPRGATAVRRVPVRL